MTLQQDMLQIHGGTVSRVIVRWLTISRHHKSPASIICRYSWIWDDPGSDLKLPWV